MSERKEGFLDCLGNGCDIYSCEAENELIGEDVGVDDGYL